MPNGVTLKFRAAPHRFAQAIESVDDAAAREYLMAVFNLMWEQRIDSIDGRRGLGWFSEVVGRHIPLSFVASDVIVPWLRELRDDRLRTMPETLSGRMSFYIAPFLDVAGLDVETPETQLFNWAKRNAPAIATLPAMKRGACLGQMLAGEECPDFELVLSPRITPDSNVCRVLFDAQSLFVRELVVDAIHSSRKQYTAARAGSVVEASRLFTGGMGFVPRRLSDFTVETFTRQHEYISENLGGHRRARALSGLVAIYLHIIELLPPGPGAVHVRDGAATTVSQET